MPCPAGTWSSTQGLSAASQCTACSAGARCLVVCCCHGLCFAGTYSTALGATTSSACASCLAGGMSFWQCKLSRLLQDAIAPAVLQGKCRVLLVPTTATQAPARCLRAEIAQAVRPRDSCLFDSCSRYLLPSGEHIDVGVVPCWRILSCRISACSLPRWYAAAPFDRFVHFSTVLLAGGYGNVPGTATQATGCPGTCTAGYYCPAGSTTGTAVVCPAGSYCSAGSGSPTPCPAGYYGASQGLTSSTCSGACTTPGLLFAHCKRRHKGAIQARSACKAARLTPGSAHSEPTAPIRPP